MTPSNTFPEITAPPASEVRMVKSVRQYGHLVSKFVIAAQASQHAS